MPVPMTTSSGSSAAAQTASSRRSRLTRQIAAARSCLAARFLDDRARRDLSLMNIQPNDPLVDRNQFHTVSFRQNLNAGGGGCQNRNCLKATGRQRPFNVCARWQQSGVRVGSAGHVSLRGRAAKMLRDLYPPLPNPHLLSSSGAAATAMTDIDQHAPFACSALIDFDQADFNDPVIRQKSGVPGRGGRSSTGHGSARRSQHGGVPDDHRKAARRTDRTARQLSGPRPSPRW
jgi:hypothetical protein